MVLNIADYKATNGDALYERDNIRSIYARECDAIIYSNAFKRLAHKSQIFSSPQNDHVRTRLTHTYEVIRISKHIARACGLNEDLTEAIALGHDIGHAPFGHTGEAALDEIVKEHNVAVGWKHAENSVKVLSQIHSYYGRPFSDETLDGIKKHKMNYTDFLSEMPITIEGQIVRFADDMAYLIHDIEDAHRVGLIDKVKILDDLVKKDRHTLAGNEVKISSLSEEARGLLSPELHLRLKAAIKKFVEHNKATFGQNLDNSSKPCLVLEPECATLMNLIYNKIIREKIHQDPRVDNRVNEGKRIVKAVFNYYLRYSKEKKLFGNDDKDYEKFIDDRDGNIKMEDAKDKLILVEFISSMTDRYLLRKYEHVLYPATK